MYIRLLTWCPIAVPYIYIYCSTCTRDHTNSFTNYVKISFADVLSCLVLFPSLISEYSSWSLTVHQSLSFPWSSPIQCFTANPRILKNNSLWSNCLAVNSWVFKFTSITAICQIQASSASCAQLHSVTVLMWSPAKLCTVTPSLSVITVTVMHHQDSQQRIARDHGSQVASCSQVQCQQAASGWQCMLLSKQH